MEPFKSLSNMENVSLNSNRRSSCNEVAIMKTLKRLILNKLAKLEDAIAIYKYETVTDPLTDSGRC